MATVEKARFSLIFRGSDLPLDIISERMGIKPTSVIHKGDELIRLPRVVADADEWIYAVPLTEPNGADQALNDLLDVVHDRITDITRMGQNFSVSLHLYVQSDRAQITYRLMPETMRKLCATGLPLDVSSISWGETGI